MNMRDTLIKEFVQSINTKPEKKVSMYYGTIVGVEYDELDDSKIAYVHLDGSEDDLKTPIVEGTEVLEGDRVLVTIENHQAIVLANITSPASARTAKNYMDLSEEDEGLVIGMIENDDNNFNVLIKADGVYVRDGQDVLAVYGGEGTYIYADGEPAAEFTAEGIQFFTELANYARFDPTTGEFTSQALAYLHADNLDATYASVDDLDAANAKITNLEADNVTINGTLTAQSAKITSLEAEDVTINNTLTSHRADIDDLEADNVTINNTLTAHRADIDDLEADNVTINNTLTAHRADIDDLEADNVTINNTLTAHRADIDDLEADNVTINNTLTAHRADIDDLEADNVTINNTLTAHRADIDDLEADNVTINGKLTAQSARIGAIEANYVATDVLEAGYAHIDLANVNNAWIENGVIKNAAITNEQVLSVSANKLTAGTIDASEINVANLRAKNLIVEKVNGQPVLGGYELVNKNSTGYSGKNPRTEGWYEYQNGTFVASTDTTVNTTKAYYKDGNQVALYDQTYIDGLESNLNQRIDGAVETFTGTVVPTLVTYPASDWTSAQMASHVGDIYYVVNSAIAEDGYCYRFAYDNTTSSYKWILIKDSDVTKALSDIDDLQDFESSTTSWIEETDEGLRTIRENHTSLSGVVNKTVKSSIQLWFTKSNTTAPTAPNLTTYPNGVSDTSTSGNGWRTVVPTYNASYPYYYYCWQYKFVDDSYGWSAVIYDRATSESEERARTGVANAATADGKAVSAQNTANDNIKSSVMLWFTKANDTAPSKPTAVVTTSNASTANAWNLLVPTYNSSYPYYFYCYQQQKGDGSYQWSNVIYDRATTETQSTSRATSSALANYVSTNDAAIQALQSQVDGQLEIWYGTVTPTTSNTPASGWSTSTDKDNHIGDMYYDTTNGKVYQWTKSGSTYSWTEIPDSSAAAALAAAQDAQATADGKRRVFTSQPTVPYDIGDLWVNGDEVKYATKKRTTGSYTASEWAQTATDDTVANANIKSSVQLWITKSASTDISKPYTDGSTNYINSTSTAGNTWTTVVPVYNSSYPYYHYCYQQQRGDGKYQWTTPVYDDATSVAMKKAQEALPAADFTTFQSTTFKEVKDTVDEQSSTITTLSNRVDTKADSSTVTTLSNTVNSVSQTATSNSSTLSQLTQTLGTNADGTTKTDDIMHRMSATEQDLNGFKTTVSQTYATQSSVPTKVSDLTNDSNFATEGYADGKASAAQSAAIADANKKLASQFATSSTAKGTAAKVATITPAVTGWTLYTGASITVKFIYENTAATPTLNVNSTGAKTIKAYTGTAALSDKEYKWPAGATMSFVYDGTYWRIQDSTELIRLSSAESSITQTANSIVSLVANTDTYTKPDGTTATNTIKSAIKQNADNIALRVEKSGVISAINLTSETAKIQASKVEIDGTAIFNNSDFQNALDGENFATTGDIPTKVSDLTNDSGFQTATQVSDAVTNGVSGKADKSETLKSVTTKDQYYLSTSRSSATGGTWQDTVPTWSANKYIWTRVATTKTPVSGTATTTYSTAVYDSALTSALSTASAAQTSANSAASTVVTTKQYYLSTSSSSATGGSWGDSVPTWANNKYIWIRFKIVKTPVSGTATTSYSPSENGVYDSTVTTALSTAYTANNGLSNKADKTAAVTKTQRIYYRSNSSTKPTGYPTAWVTESGNKWNSNATTATGWSLKKTPISNGTGASVTKYLYLWCATQRQTVDGTTQELIADDIALDDSTTVIDGGKIITGSVAANSISATSGTFDAANIPNLSADKITAGTINVSRIPDAALNSNVQVGGRNLLKNSENNIVFLWSTAKSNGATMTKESNITVSEWNTNKAYRAYGNAGSTNKLFGIINGIYGTNDTSVSGETYTFSIYVKNQSATNILTVSCNGVADSVTIAPGEITRVVSTGVGNGSQALQFTISAEASSGAYDFVYWHPQIEIGNTVTDWSPAPEDVENKIDSIEIGGRNLLTGTDTLTIADGSWPAGKFYKSGSGGTLENVTLPSTPIPSITKGLKVTITTANTDIGFAQGDVPLRKQEITQSVWIKGTAGDKVVLQPIYSSASGSEESGRETITIADSNWNRYTFTKTPNYEHLSGNSLAAGYVYVRSSSVGRIIYICADKLEYGNKATDWSPAPEDVQSELDKKKSIFNILSSVVEGRSYANILSYANGINTFSVYNSADGYDSVSDLKVGDTVRLAYKISNVTGTPYAYIMGTVTEIRSSTSITLNSRGVSTTIIDGGNILTDTITADKIKANSLSIGKLTNEAQTAMLNSNIKIGGRNLVPMSLNLKGFTTDNVAGQSTTIFTDNDCTIENIISGDTTSHKGIYHNVYIEPSSTYVISVIASSLTGTCQISIGDQTPGTSINGWSGIKTYTNLVEGFNSITFTTTNDCTRIRIYICAQGFGSKVTLTKFKLEQGNVATDWSPFSEDAVLGGRNLLSNTDVQRVSPASASSSAYVAPVPEFTDYGASILNNTDDIFVYTFDYEVTGNTASTAYVYAQIRSVSIDGGLVVGGAVSKSVYDEPIGSYYVAFRLTSAQATTTTDKRAGIRLRNASDGAILKVKNIKLERGIVPTAWSAAPEDTQDSTFVQGTGTTAGLWKGTLNKSSLTNGMQITYWTNIIGSSLIQPNNETVASNIQGGVPATVTSGFGGTWLNLTLSDGTETGWYPCFYGGSSRLTTHYGANNAVRLTFKTGITMSINSTSYTVSGWWSDANYNSNTVGIYGGNVTAGANGIRPYSLIMKTGESQWSSLTTSAVTGTGTNKSRYTGGFLLGKIMYNSNNTTYNSGNSSGACYDAYSLDFRYSTNCGTTLVKGKDVYIVGQVSSSDKLFRLNATWWTQTIPTSEDGNTYIYVGTAYSTYQVYLSADNTAYRFVNGAFNAIDTVENFIRADSTGLMVYDGTSGQATSSNVTTSNVLITSNGMNIRNGTTVLTSYGSDTRFYSSNGTLTAKIENNATYGSLMSINHLVVSSSSNPSVNDMWIGPGGISTTRSYEDGSTWAECVMGINGGEIHMDSHKSDATGLIGAISIKPGRILATSYANSPVAATIRAASAAGSIYMYSQPTSSGNRGIYAIDGSSTFKAVIDITSNNLCYFRGAADSVSDLKKKDVIADYDWKIDDFINGLKPIAYRFKHDDGSLGDRIRMGFGAQDVRELTRSLYDEELSLYRARIIDETKEGTEREQPYHGEDIDDEKLLWSLTYEELIAPMVLEIQRLMARVDKLEEELKKYQNGSDI